MGGLVELDRALGILAEHAVDDTDVEMEVCVQRLLRVGENPCLTGHRKSPGMPPEPSEVTFRLSPSYGPTTGHEANEWFLDMITSTRSSRSRRTL